MQLMIQVCICDLVSVWGRASDGKFPTKTVEEWSNLLAANSHPHVHPIGYIRGFKEVKFINLSFVSWAYFHSLF